MSAIKICYDHTVINDDDGGGGGEDDDKGTMMHLQSFLVNVTLMVCKSPQESLVYCALIG